MPRVPLTFGGGLDRETGVMATRPGGMEDLRNVHIMLGKYQVRRGFEKIHEFNDGSSDMTDMLGGIAVKGQRAAIYVCYDSVAGKVHVFYGDGDATWVAYLGEWLFQDDQATPVDLLDAGADPPVIQLAEYNGHVFMAHTTAAVNQRAQTYHAYFDDATSQWKLEAFHVSGWDGPTGDPGGNQNVRFRGVCKHLDYIFGWGWGDEDNPKRPEIVRFCNAGDPETWSEYHYFITGDEGDPIVTCIPAGHTLLAFKETEVYELFGRAPHEFGQRLMDPLYGMVEPRLAVNVSGLVFAWTNEGPRIFDGTGPSESLEIPLELTLPEPADLAIEGDSEYAFAVYMPVYRSVWFVFGQRVYSIYIRVPGDWKWGYQELTGFTPMCGFRLPQAGWGTVEAPTGYPSSPTMSSITDTTATVTTTNNGQDGDETLEVWLKDDGGTWALHASFEVTSSASDANDLTGLTPGWDIDLACRYRRGPYYTTGYTSSDPDDWPAGCKTSFTTTLASLPTIDSTLWSRESATIEQIAVTITPPYTGTGYDVEIRRDPSGTPVLIDTEEDVGGQFTHNDTGCTGEATNEYDCRLVTPYVNGSYVTPVERWGGPPAPSSPVGTAVSPNRYEMEWVNGGSYPTEIWDDLTDDDGTLDNLRDTAAADDTTWLSDSTPAWNGYYLTAGVRHKQTLFSVDDYSDMAEASRFGPIPS